MKRRLCALGIVLSLAVPAAVGAQESDKAERIAALKERIETLRQNVLRAEAVSDVKRLQRAFGYYIDRGYWHEAADLFAEDASLEVGGDGIYIGKARILERLIAEGGGNPGPGLPYGQLYHHMQLQPVIHIGPDGRTAKGRWREFALLGQFQEWAAWGDGIYENEYVKENGVWKIQTMHLYPNFKAPYQEGWESLAPVDGDWSSETAEKLPPDAPPSVEYKPFPNVFVPPFHYDNPVTGE